MFPEYTGNSIFLLPDFTMFRIWNTLPECIRNTCLFPECNWNTVSNFIILRNAPPKYTRNTLEIKKNIKKMTLTSAMNFVFFCNPSNASLGLLWLLLSRVSGEVDASSSRRTRLSQCDGIYLRIQWKDVKGCERVWKNVKGCERMWNDIWATRNVVLRPMLTSLEAKYTADWVSYMGTGWHKHARDWRGRAEAKLRLGWGKDNNV